MCERHMDPSQPRRERRRCGVHLLAEQLRSQASALVEGALWERVRRGVGGSWSEVCLIGRDLNVRRETLLDSAEARSARREGFAAAVQWAPWPRRSAVA